MRQSSKRVSDSAEKTVRDIRRANTSASLSRGGPGVRVRKERQVKTRLRSFPDGAEDVRQAASSPQPELICCPAS
jgi:hypothetical protein